MVKDKVSYNQATVEIFCSVLSAHTLFGSGTQLEEVEEDVRRPKTKWVWEIGIVFQ